MQRCENGGVCAQGQSGGRGSSLTSAIESYPGCPGCTYNSFIVHGSSSRIQLKDLLWSLREHQEAIINALLNMNGKENTSQSDPVWTGIVQINSHLWAIVVIYIQYIIHLGLWSCILTGRLCFVDKNGMFYVKKCKFRIVLKKKFGSLVVGDPLSIASITTFWCSFRCWKPFCSIPLSFWEKCIFWKKWTMNFSILQKAGLTENKNSVATRCSY